MRSELSVEIRTSDYAVFSVGATPVHEAMSFMLEHNIGFQVMLGKYEDQEETSFIVKRSDLHHIYNAGLIDDQESVLILGPNINETRDASIIYLTNKDEIQYIGQLIAVQRERALEEKAYSYNVLSQQYFIIVPVTRNELIE